MLVAIHIGDFETLLTLGLFTECNGTGHFSQHAGIFWRARLEQLGYSWQTAGNVTRLLRFGRDTRQYFTHRHWLTIFNGNQRTDLEADSYRVIGTGDFDFLPQLVKQFHLRTHRTGGGAATLGIDHHQR